MDSVALGVIDDARGRQRRRIGVLAALALVAGIALGLAISRMNGPPGPSTVARAPLRVAPATVLSQAPDLGVACHRGACDSVGLAVWLRAPAVAVSATIGRHGFGLTTWEARPFAPSSPRTMFVGYLTPLRLVTGVRLAHGPPADWPAAGGPHPVVSLRIRFRGGRIVETRLSVPLEPGWG